MLDLSHTAATIILPFLMLLGACSSLSVERVGKSTDTSNNGGLPYSLEKPVILATVQRSFAYKGQNIVNGVDLGSPVDTTTFSLALVKDPKETYAIYLKPGWFTADSQDIVYNARGGFNSFNFTSTDQTATVVATVGKIASTAALFGVAEQVEDAAPPPGSGQIETVTQKTYEKILSDLTALSLKAGQMSKDDLAAFDSLLKDAQSLKALIYPASSHTIQVIDAPIVFVDSPTQSLDELVTNQPADYYSRSKLGIIGIARRVQ